MWRMFENSCFIHYGRYVTYENNNVIALGYIKKELLLWQLHIWFNSIRQTHHVTPIQNCVLCVLAPSNP